MYLKYGTTALQVIDLNRYERTNIYTEDGADLLYVKHVIGVSAVYAPGGVPQQTSVVSLSPNTAATLAGSDNTLAITSANPRGQPPAGINPTPLLEPPSATPAPWNTQYNGVETDTELRYRLLTPRLPLSLVGYDRQTGAAVQWLQSPRPGYFVDSKNGPRPISCDVIAADGETAIGVFYQIETHVQPCPIGSDMFVLSHRWTMRHTHDDNNYLTRIIEGTIVFNTEAIYNGTYTPDMVRNQFIHPVPLGYRRHVPMIEQSSDGTTIHYVIADTDPTIVFEPADSGATSIEIIENMQYSVPAFAVWAERNKSGIRKGIEAFGSTLLNPYGMGTINTIVGAGR